LTLSLVLVESISFSPAILAHYPEARRSVPTTYR
jgi:hypothetical protein